jgi:hypothetical protein
LAYIIEEDDKAVQAPEGKGSLAPIGSPSPQPVGVAPNVPGASGGHVGGGTVGGSGFVNFDRILSANKDSANSMADSVNTNVANAAAGAQGAVRATQAKFSDDVRAGSTAYSGQKVSNQPSNGTATGVAGYAAQPTSSGKALAATGARSGMLPEPEQGGSVSREEAADRADNVYNGPDSLADNRYNYAALQTQVQDAAAGLNSLNSAGGLQALLQKQTTGPYTQGQSAFDAALTGAVGGDRFTATQNTYAGLDKLLEQANAQAKAQADAARKSTSDAAAQYGQAVSDYDSAEKTKADAAAQAETIRKEDAVADEVWSYVNKFADTYKNDPDRDRIIRDGIIKKYGPEVYEMWVRSNQRKSSKVSNTMSGGAVGGVK